VSALRQQNENLSTIHIPTLLLHSENDHVVAVSSTDLVASAVPGPVERVDLPNGFHVATIDLDKDEINSRALDFVAKLTTP
jgi:carboxylesterase